MTSPAIAPDRQRIHREKRAAAVGSLIVALLMAALKLAAGLLTGSLALLSEAAHSGLDLIASAITLFSVEASIRPPDENHNYGHGKIESLSAFMEVFLMLASCAWIIYVALGRILHHPVPLELSPWTFGVPLLALIVDSLRSRSLLRIAHRYGSPALEADGIHFRTDIWSSLAVLAGLIATWAGTRWHIASLEFADPVAALIVSAIILFACWRLARQTIDALLDAIPRQTQRDLVRALRNIDGVHDVERVRVRRAGSDYFVDLTLGLDRTLTFQRSEQIVVSATEAVKHLLPAADVVIHTIPRETSSESVFDRIRAVAARSNVAIHEVTVQQIDGKLHVEQHVEVDEMLSLRQAHDFVTALEHRILHDVPEIAAILTHIESEPGHIAHPASVELDDRIIQTGLHRVAAGFPQIIDVHEVLISRLGDHIQISCHCTLPDDLSMEQVHDAITALEIAVKHELPQVYRMLIHPEPATDNRR